MVGLTSLISQRFGQSLAGLLSGLPVIAATVTALLMTEASREQVVAVAQATYLSAPAAFAYTIAFAWVARWVADSPSRSAFKAWVERKRIQAWCVCFILAAGVFIATSVLMLTFNTNPAWGAALALLCPALALMLMPRLASNAPMSFQIPKRELSLRMLVAFLMALVLLWSAGHLSPSLSGIILTWPVTGSVLPCFTVALYGAQATIQLLRGFANGLLGFTAFFVILSQLLKAGWPYTSSFLVSAIVASSAAWLLMRFRQQVRAW